MKKSAFFYVVLFFIEFFSQPQRMLAQTKVVGTIKTADAKELENASLLLLHIKDSSMVKGVTTNAKGIFVLDKLLPGNYFLQASFAGYIDHYSKPFLITSENITKDIGTINLQPLAQLNNVVVTAKKPPFEAKIDRLVINVKSSITNAGSTVLDVLEKSPGVVVNRANNAIALNGKDGVIVMINGRINYMQPDAIVQMLNGMNAAMVEKIELITTPPAKYDAGGNAGYINIVLLNNPDEGFNGSYNASFGVGHGTSAAASTNFNYRKRKLNIYGDYSFSREAQTQVFTNYRSVEYNNIFKENDGVSNRDPIQRNHNARLGIDYNLSKSTVIGGIISGYDNKWSMNAVNMSLYKQNYKTDTIVTIDNNEINHWKHMMGNFNFQHNFKNGGEIQFNTDYLYYWNENPTGYLNKYASGNGDYLSSDNTKSGKETIIHTWVTELDYNRKLDKKTNIEMGAKAVVSNFTNDVLVAKLVQNIWVPDPKFTAKFTLHENVQAAYFSIDRTIDDKTSLKAGLRYEHTTTNLGSETQKNIVDRKYGNFFPTFYISHKFNDKNGVNFSYSKRISRPSFNQLAPFLIFFDPKTFISGNPAVQPAYTDAIKADYLYSKIVFSIGYSYEKNTIARFLAETNPVDNSQIITAQNLDYTKLIFVSVGTPFKFANWWNGQLSVSGNWSKVQGVINKQTASFSNYYVSINASQTFTLPKNFTAEVSGMYQSKSYSFGAFLVDPFGGLNIAVSKKIEKWHGTFVVGVDNMLNTYIFKVHTTVPGQGIVVNGSYQFSYPLYKLSWTQSFGNKVLKEKRARGTASDDERRRVE